MNNFSSHGSYITFHLQIASCALLKICAKRIYEGRDWNKSSFVNGTHHTMSLKESWAREGLWWWQICGLSSSTVEFFYKAELNLFKRYISGSEFLRVDLIASQETRRVRNDIKSRSLLASRGRKPFKYLRRNACTRSFKIEKPSTL